MIAPRVLATVVAALLQVAPFSTVRAKQQQRTIIARPGNHLVNGFLLESARRRFKILSLPCEESTTSTSQEIGSMTEEIMLVRDSIVLRIRHQSWTDGTSFVDTTAYSRLTLAPLWDRTHSTKWSSSWEFHGARAIWSSQQAGRNRESLDSALDEPRFFAGSDELLFPATPRLYAGETIAYLILDLAQGPGEPASFGMYTTRARVSGSEFVALPPNRRVEAWVVIADEAFGRYKYWIDKQSQDVVMWQTPEYESLCPMRYVVASP